MFADLEADKKGLRHQRSHINAEEESKGGGATAEAKKLAGSMLGQKKKSVQLGYSTKQVQDTQTHQSSSLVRKSQELTSDVKPKSLYSKHKGVSTYIEKPVTQPDSHQQQQQATTNSYEPD